MKRKKRTLATGVGVAALGLALAAAIFALPAAAGEYGRLDLDGEVTKTFHEGRQLEGHTYYYSGMVNRPDGIIAIAEPYRLRTELWKVIDPQRQNFRELVGQMRLEGGGTGRFVLGRWILDPQGKRIGLWFSELDRTTVRMRGDTEVEIATPGRLLDLRPDSGHNTIWGN